MSSSVNIIFDLDGTLIDTAPDLAKTLNTMLRRRKLEYLPESEVRHLVGDGARALITYAMAKYNIILTSNELEDYFCEFLECYSNNIHDMSQPFPNLVSTLEELKSKDYNIAICTNKPEALAVDLITKLGLRSFFEVIIGGDTLNVRKPHPEHILTTISKLKSPGKNIVMVGDSSNDIIAAKAANIPSIAVSFGYCSVPVIDLGADLIIDNFLYLPEAIISIFDDIDSY